MSRTRAWRTAGAAALLLAPMAVGIAPARAEEAAVPAYSAHGADTCLVCHNEPELMGLFRTAHARPNDAGGPFGHGGLQCEACHGPGGAHVKAKGKQPAGIVDFGPHAAASVVRQNTMCLGCHRANAAHDWDASAHAANGVACASCHTLHAAHDPVRSADSQTEVCTACHQTERGDLLKLSHHPVREGKMACTACHSPHGSTAPAQLAHNTVNETCTTCHAEYRGPFLWEHQPVAEDCSNCHDAHGSAQAALLKTRPPFLCQQCHDGAGHPSILNGPQGLPGGTPSAYLLAGGCVNCHTQVHGSNHPSGRALMR